MSQHLTPFGDPDKEHKVEKAKRESNYLHGEIAETLASDAECFSQEDYQVLKFHGIYQQDDRDTRVANKAAGLGKDYIYMIRVKIPGGEMTADQYLAMDRLAEDVTWNNRLRVTTRQNFQVHGVLKGDLKQTIRRTNEAMLSTLAGCGDVERNVMAPPAPFADEPHARLRETAQALARDLCPQSPAYHEIWFDGEKVDAGASSENPEPLYKDQYLPRKFKTGLALPEDNSIDAHSQDVALIGLVDDGELVGFNVLVGGGFGMTHRKEHTYARLGTPFCSIGPDQAVETVQALASIHRDFGDREDRTHARIKYIVEEQGVENVFKEFCERVSFTPGAWDDAMGELEHRDWLGAHDQGDGKQFYGVHLPNGRIIDEGPVRRKTALNKIVRALKPRVILTPNQNVILGDLDEQGVKTVERILSSLGVPLPEKLSAVERYAMACPAQPTCGLALTESERVFGHVVASLDEELEHLGLQDEPITVRMTGCPNGCARPYSADIGLVGHKPGHYDLFLGGRLDGDRMAEFVAENVPMEELVPTLRPLFEAWRDHRMPDEPLGDFYERVCGSSDRRRDIQTGDRKSPAKERVDAALAELTVSAGA